MSVPPIPEEFAAAAALFPRTVKRLIVDPQGHPEDVSLDELLSELRSKYPGAEGG